MAKPAEGGAAGHLCGRALCGLRFTPAVDQQARFTRLRISTCVISRQRQTTACVDRLRRAAPPTAALTILPSRRTGATWRSSPHASNLVKGDTNQRQRYFRLRSSKPAKCGAPRWPSDGTEANGLLQPSDDFRLGALRGLLFTGG